MPNMSEQVTVACEQGVIDVGVIIAFDCLIMSLLCCVTNHLMTGPKGNRTETSCAVNPDSQAHYGPFSRSGQTVSGD